MTQTPPADTSRIAKFSPKPTSEAAARKSTLRPSIILFALGATATIALVSWLGLFSERDDIRLDITNVAVDSNGNVELTGAQYRGRTADGTPFEINAEIASENQDGSGRIDLTAPVAKLHNSEGTIDVVSNTGIFYQQRKMIELTGGVVVNDGARQMTLKTEMLTANFGDGDMASDVMVTVQNDTSIITADGLRVSGNGERVIFVGNAKMTLHSDSVLE